MLQLYKQKYKMNLEKILQIEYNWSTIQQQKILIKIFKMENLMIQKIKYTLVKIGLKEKNIKIK